MTLAEFTRDAFDNYLTKKRETTPPVCAEAKAEGWDDAVKALRSCGLINAADWLAANRPSPAGRKG